MVKPRDPQMWFNWTPITEYNPETQNQVTVRARCNTCKKTTKKMESGHMSRHRLVDIYS